MAFATGFDFLAHLRRFSFLVLWKSLLLDCTFLFGDNLRTPDRTSLLLSIRASMIGLLLWIFEIVSSHAHGRNPCSNLEIYACNPCKLWFLACVFSVENHTGRSLLSGELLHTP
jgi:hypothetical protein